MRYPGPAGDAASGDRCLVTPPALEGALQALYGANSRVGNVGLLASGFEADVFAFSVETTSGSSDAVARVYRGSGATVTEKATREFTVMRRLHTLGYPVPRVSALSAIHDVRRRPFIVMDRIRGRSLGQRYWSADQESKQAARATLHGLMTRLHRIDANRVIPTADSPRLVLERDLSDLDQTLDQLGRAGPPSLRTAMRWLRDNSHRVGCDRVGLVHGDFHYNNVLVNDDEALFVIDWSNVRVADPRHDIAWLAIVTSGDRDVRAYEHDTGAAVTELEFFEVIAALRLLLDTISTLRFGATRRGLGSGLETRIRNGSHHTKTVAARLQDITHTLMPDLDDTLAALLQPA